MLLDGFTARHLMSPMWLQGMQAYDVEDDNDKDMPPVSMREKIEELGGLSQDVCAGQPSSDCQELASKRCSNGSSLHTCQILGFAICL